MIICIYSIEYSTKTRYLYLVLCLFLQTSETCYCQTEEVVGEIRGYVNTLTGSLLRRVYNIQQNIHFETNRVVV